MKSLFLVLPLLGGSILAAPQDERARGETPSSEGALNNDVFVPQHEAAAEALAEGDRALKLAHVSDGSVPASERERQLDIALARWRAALVRGRVGAVVSVVPPPGSEARLGEGVHAAVLRRLLGLSADERARWHERVEPEARKLLETARAEFPPGQRAGALLDLVHGAPATAAAATAALELGDLALEAGLLARARGWYARSELQAELAGAGRLLEAATARLERAAGAAATPDPATEIWRTASACEATGELGWRAQRDRSPRRPERRPRPGGAFLPDGRFFVQTDGELFLFSQTEAGALELSAKATHDDILGELKPERVLAPLDPPGWPLLPQADEHGLVLVLGRGLLNSLVALEVQAATDLAQLGLSFGRRQTPLRLSWAIVGPIRINRSGSGGSPSDELLPELEALGEFEFQPGAVISGGLVIVQARQFEGQVRAWLLAFDRRDGTLAWSRLLCAGADRVLTTRFAQNQRRVAAQPLLALDDEDAAQVFVGTHLGLGLLFDTLLGEPLWSLRNRRRAEHASGWRGDRPLPTADPGAPLRVLWAPMDSDRLYTLVPGPLVLGVLDDVLAAPPLALSEATALLGGDVGETLVLGRSGKEHTVTARRAGQDAVEALDLGRDERFSGQGLVSKTRAWVASDRGLYLLDRTRELYLLDYDTLPSIGEEPPGGDLFARAGLVVVLGSSALWSFRAR